MEEFRFWYSVFGVEDLEEVIQDVEREEIRTDWFGRKFTFTKEPDG